uniref:Uncharacterized protein n=1 Tax=Ascaris lumbricoides TaxID=6252 RepID=A0A0M3HP47_ASCLU
MRFSRRVIIYYNITYVSGNYASVFFIALLSSYCVSLIIKCFFSRSTV